jgi:hypothetical protein
VFGWTPGIGDPTIYGWVTVAAYALGTLCCWRASRLAPSSERRFWLLLTLVLAFLCVNKQLDLQSLFTGFGRFEAKAHGWYDVRHKYQVAFIVILAVASVIAVLAMLMRASRARGAVRGAIVGLSFLLLFVLVRASSFHKVDWFINLHVRGIRANHLLELGGIGIVTVFALGAVTKKKRRRRLA